MLQHAGSKGCFVCYGEHNIQFFIPLGMNYTPDRHQCKPKFHPVRDFFLAQVFIWPRGETWQTRQIWILVARMHLPGSTPGAATFYYIVNIYFYTRAKFMQFYLLAFYTSNAYHPLKN